MNCSHIGLYHRGGEDVTKRIIVVGGDAAGATTATKIKRDDEKTDVVMYERGSRISFVNCGLSYYLGRDIKNRDDLFVVTPEKLEERYDVKVKIRHEVKSINREEKKIEVENLETGEVFYDSYDKLVVTTGGTPIRPPIPGMNLENIFTLFTVPDVDAIEESLAKNNIENVVVIGGDFIGLEAVEAFVNRGKKVTLVEKADQVLSMFDKEMVNSIELHLAEMGVKVIVGDGVKEFVGDGKLSSIVLESGKRISAELSIFSIGVKPQCNILKDAGLEIGKTGGVVVNANMRTSDPHIYVGGDIAEVVHLVNSKKTRIPLGGPANNQGRVIGANVVGGNKIFRGVLGTSIVKVGELTAAKTGITEKEAEQEGFAYYVSYAPSANHATYYPNAKSIYNKLIVEQFSGRILGAEAVGWEGTDKRIDVLATAIYGNMTVEDLENLDLAPVPPYSGVKDPIVTAGCVASNILRGELEIITPAEMDELGEVEPIHIIDVRKETEFQKGSINNADNLCIDEMRKKCDNLDRNKTVVVYCKKGCKGYLAYKILKNLGFLKVYNLTGGYMNYMADVRIEE